MGEEIRVEHSYEEIRQMVVNILAGKESQTCKVSQYENLKIAIAQVLDDREGSRQRNSGMVGITPLGGHRSSLSRNDSDLLLEVFWGLFREGIITLGLNDANREFPWFRVSSFGKKILDNQDLYFFHDVTSYEALIKTEIPYIDDITLIYLKEAMQDFRSGCLLSSSVMLGVAAEHTFMQLLETIESNPEHQTIFRSVNNERSVLRRLNKFKNILDQNKNLLSSEVKEDLDTNFMGITSIIRNFRNESGHPSGRIISREQCYVLLQLFIPYCKKMYQLIDAFR